MSGAGDIKPRGLKDTMRWVRPLISCAMAGTVIYGFLVQMIPWEAFAPIAIGAIGWWYYRRDQEKRGVL